MLLLDFTVEREGIEITTLDRLMISESQINNLLDNLVSVGFDIISTYVREENK